MIVWCALALPLEMFLLTYGPRMALEREVAHTYFAISLNLSARARPPSMERESAGKGFARTARLAGSQSRDAGG